MGWIWTIGKLLLGFLGIFILYLIGILIIFRRRISKTKTMIKKEKPGILMNFFHPFCNDMGGGEKVLYQMLQTLFNHIEEIEKSLGQPLHIGIYYFSDESPENILRRVKERFKINLCDKKLCFVRLGKARKLMPEGYPTFTLLRQALGSIFVIHEALIKHPADVLVDTMGFGWIYPIAKLLCAGMKIISYTHYPYVSSDMISKVGTRTSDFNNRQDIAASGWKTALKQQYYRFIVYLYRKVGYYADLIMVNSTWTFNHMADLWSNNRKNICILYPPCTVKQFFDAPLEGRERKVISLGQFRPEKNHKMQIEAFRHVLNKDKKYKDVKLVLIGSSRSAEDEARVTELRNIVKLRNYKKEEKMYLFLFSVLVNRSRL